jgi:L-fuculose-phosphate aldolase
MTLMESERPEVLPMLTPQAEIALLARALYRDGWNDYDVGHITYRQDDETFLTLPLELGWDETKASDILRIDIDGNKLEGKWSVTPPIRLHLEFHKARPGCDVTVHQHPQYSTIWSCAGRIPPAYDQRSAAVADHEIVLYDDYKGGVAGEESAKAAVRGMGDYNVALLRNHGAFVVGNTISQAYTRSSCLEWRCKQAWFAEAIGAKNTVPEYGAKSISESMAAFGGQTPWMWEWAARREIRIDPSVLD